MFMIEVAIFVMEVAISNIAIKIESPVIVNSRGLSILPSFHATKR